MDLGWLASVTGFAVAMAATPGPNNLMGAASGAAYGLARSLPLTAGVGIGVGAIMLVVAAFGSAVFADPRVSETLKWVGLAYLLWLAWKIGSAEPRPPEVGAENPVQTTPLSFTHGAFLQLVNPKLWVMVSGALVAYGPDTDADRLGLALLFALIFGMATFLSTLAWTALGASFGRLLASRRSARAFNIAMALLLVASLIPIVLE
jgi:threonine/homoserine/homoserine lactone efflux protein